VNIRARRAVVEAFRVLGQSATESERALAQIKSDTAELNETARETDRRVTAISTEIKAVRGDLAEIKRLLLEERREDRR
jgi:septal ring factor EnvC (AmiA/AmiB activator)